MRAALHILTAGLALLVTADLRAQGSRALVGSWERLSLRSATGEALQPPAPAAFLIMSADGHYTQLSIPTGRAKLAKPLAELTREELLARFERSEGRHGRYTVAGDTLTRTYVASLTPDQEGGAPQRQRYRIDGDVLILTSVAANNQSEARFRRVK